MPNEREDIYHVFKFHASGMSSPLQNLVPITTDGASAMVGSRNGLVGLFRKD